MFENIIAIRWADGSNFTRKIARKVWANTKRSAVAINGMWF